MEYYKTHTTNYVFAAEEWIIDKSTDFYIHLPIVSFSWLSMNIIIFLYGNR